MKKTMTVMLALALVLLPGCAGLKYSVEERERLQEIASELESVQDLIKKMRESESVDPVALADLLERSLSLKSELKDIYEDAQSRGFNFFEMVGIALGTYLGGRQGRLGLSTLVGRYLKKEEEA